jgi:hypothetical protein
VLTPVLERETRARDEVLDGARDENLSGSGERRHARTDMDGKLTAFFARTI